jgi:HSP20 family protein
MKGVIPWGGRGSALMEPLRQEMEDLFHRFFPTLEEAATPLSAWAPRVDVEETDKEILVKADVPGVDAKDVEITVSDGTLVLRGEKKQEKEENGKNYRRAERFVGKFYRELPLPAGTDPEKIAATTDKGVVIISIPKKPEAQPRKITVKPRD